MRMPRMTFDDEAALVLDALAYVTALYEEVAQENGAPTLGTQNQVVDFIREDPELREYVREWARRRSVREATIEPPQRLPQDPQYWRIRSEMVRDMAERVPERPEKANR
jgi:hypothetical protein